MPVDPTISLDGQQYQAPNPLAQIGQAIPLINQANQNQLFQQQNQARQAIGQAYQQATNPLTGELDTNRLSALVANDPRAAFMAGDVAKQSLERQQQQLQLLQQNYKFNMDRLNGLQSRLSGLLAEPGPITKDMVAKHATDWASDMNSDPEHPTIPASLVTKLLGQLPNDPAQIRPALKQALLNTLDAKQRLDAIMPAPTQINMGDRTELQRLPQVGSPSSEGYLKPGYSPGEGAHPQPGVVTDPNSPQYGAPTQTPTREAFPLNPPTGVQPPGGAASTRFPGAFTSPAQGAAPASASPSQARQTALAPGATIGLEGQAKQSTQSFNEAQANSNDYATRMYQLQEGLENLKKTPTGPGTSTLNQAKSFIAAMSPDFLQRAGITPDMEPIAAYDKANKFLLQYAQQAAKGLGGQATDEKLASAIAASPNVSHMSNLAGQELVVSAMSLERMQQAKLQAFQEQGGRPQGYNDWTTKEWNKSPISDPRIYAFDLMTPEQRTKLYQQLSKTPAQLAKFNDGLYWAMQHGMVTPPQGANGG